MARTRRRSPQPRSHNVEDQYRWRFQNGHDHSGASHSPLHPASEPPACRKYPAPGELSSSLPPAGEGLPSMPNENLAPTTSRDLSRFGVVVPVHNEELLVSAALDSLDRAISYVSDRQVLVGIAVVLDRCSDQSADLVSDWRNRTAGFHEAHHIEILEVEAGNVGSARSAGCQALIREWSDGPLEEIWLATTDADSEVPRDWIAAQLRMRSEGAQVWVGAVSVRDWSGRSPGTAEAWRCQYESEGLPIHGANFGIDATTYLDAGGFESLVTGEDRDLLRRAIVLGAAIRHDPFVRVVTSGRRDARAPQGFAHALTLIEATMPTPPLGQVELTAS